MDSSVPIQAVTILLLVLLSAFFSSAETSMTAANRIRIRSLAEQGNKRAITLEKVISNSGKMLSTILIGNNIVNIASVFSRYYLYDQGIWQYLHRRCHRCYDLTGAAFR